MLAVMEPTVDCHSDDSQGLPKRQSVLLVHYYFPPTNASAALRNWRLAKHLPQAGFDFCVLSKDENAPARVTFAAKFGDLLARATEKVFGATSERLPWISEAFLEGHRLANNDTVVAIVTSTPRMSGPILSLWLKHRTGKPLVVDFHDPYTGNPFEKPHLLRRLYQRFVEYYVFKGADALIANTDNVAERWYAKYPQFKHKIHVIWNGFDPSEAFPRSTAASNGNRLTLLHTGDLYGARSPILVIRSLDRLVKAGVVGTQDFVLRLMGPIEPEILAQLRQFDHLRASGCLDYEGNLVPRSACLDAMAEASGLLLLDLNAAGKSDQVPLKLLDYARAEKPILAITNEGSPTQRILRKSGISSTVICHSSSDDKMDEQMVQFLAACRGRYAAPNEWFRESFDSEKQAQYLATIIRDLIEKSGETPA